MRVLVFQFLLALLIFLPPSVTIASICDKLYGTKPTETSLQLGYITYHFLQPRKQLFYPLVAIMLKNSFYAGAFENSYHRLGASIGMKRIWYRHKFNSNNILQIGYMVGVVYGYCFKGSLKCASGDKFPDNIPFVPGFSIFSQYFFSKHFGISVSWAAAVFTSNLEIRWS